MEVLREIVIERPREEVFAFVADPCNDPSWCRKVRSVEGVGEGRYAVVHKPVPGRPERRMASTLTESDPPRRMRWREDDGTDLFDVTYELEEEGGATRFTQRSSFELGAPRWLHPLFRHGIGRDVAGQLRALKRLLESGTGR